MTKSAKKKPDPAKKKTAKQLKINEEVRLLKLEVRRDTRKRRKEIYESVPLEKRREFIQLCHDNGMIISMAAKELGIEFDTALLIFTKNTKKVTRHILKQPSEVK